MNLPTLLHPASFRHCNGKDALTYSVARQIARKARKYRDEAIVEYHCKACGGWHIGHVREGRKQNDNGTRSKRSFTRYVGNHQSDCADDAD